MNWVKVGERLPDHNEEVFLLLKSFSGNPEEPWFEVADFNYTYMHFSRNGNYYELDEVSHWLPITEIPLPKD